MDFFSDSNGLAKPRFVISERKTRIIGEKEEVGAR